MTDKQDPIAHAARLLREAAEELRQAHTYPRSEDWGRETDAKAAYDEHMAAAQALEDWEAAIGAGGVQALSAAPAGWKLVPVEPTVDQEWSGKNAAQRCSTMGEACKIYKAMLAASPPAEQPTPNTGHAEADRLIGRLMSSDPDFEDCRQAAELIQREIKGPDGFGTWREAAIAERLTRVNQQAAPKAAPGEQNAVSAEWLEQAYREGWAACRDAETIGEEAEDWAFGNSTANSRMIDAQQAAPQQAAPKVAPGDALDEVMRERDEAEDFINELLDEVLGADRPEWSSAYNRYDAMSDVRERITALHKPAVDKALGQFQSAMTAPPQEAQEPYAYAVYFPDQPTVELVHDLDELTDDLTNREHQITKLYTAPQPAPAPLSDDVVRDAARWRMVALIGNEVMLHPEKRTQAAAVKAYMDATHSGLDLTGAVDAALAAQERQP